MAVLQVAAAHYRQQKALAVAAENRARRLWRVVDGRDISGSWAQVADEMLVTVGSAQLLAASTADRYVDAALEEQSVSPAAAGQLQPRAFAGVASDGRDLEPLLFSAVTSAKEAIGRGVTPARALDVGGRWLAALANTQVADAGRAAVGASMAARPAVTGYVRMTSGTSCARCVVLAGRLFRWNTGFSRHPGCDCVHVPSADSEGVDDVRTDPAAHFRSLPPDEQNRVFTAPGAKAIRDGADIGQVVNARRGMSTATVYGQKATRITTEGTTRRGLAGQRIGPGRGAMRTPRLMPESIYEIAEDREDAVRLLRRFGYIT